VSIASSSQRRL